jgi:hypothetical protein
MKPPVTVRVRQDPQGGVMSESEAFRGVGDDDTPDEDEN